MLKSLTDDAPGLSWCVLVLSAARPLSPWNHQALVSLRGDLKLRVRMETGLGDKLEWAAGGFMDEHEAAAVRQERTNMEQMDKLIQLLFGKGDEDFATFLRMLRTTNSKVWAEKLEKRAEHFKEEGTCVYREETKSDVHACSSQCMLQHTSPACPVCVCERVCVCDSHAAAANLESCVHPHALGVWVWVGAQ